MHHLYFPSCPIEGPVEPPVPYSHFATRGAIPNKCAACEYCFEGGCTRYMSELQRYMHLDFGPCGVSGPTDPVYYEDNFVRSKVEVPRKCIRCQYLFHDSLFGFTCRKDSEKWGNCYRGLDWGNWRPDHVYLNLPQPKVTTKVMVSAANNDDLPTFVIEHRRVNLGYSLQEARTDFRRFREILKSGVRTTSMPKGEES